MKQLWIVWLTGLLLLISCGGDLGDGPIYPGDKPDYSAAITQVSDYIERRMQKDAIPGLAVALVDGGDLVWAEGFGYADLGGNIKTTPQTIFEIGSLSKVIAAGAVMRLKEQGVVDLDRPATEFFPELQINQSFPESGPITLRTMMTHHSGIPGDILIGAFSVEYDPYYLTWLLDYLKGEYTTYPANYFIAYSNTGVFLEGEAAAAAAGRPFTELGDEFMADIGMTDSSFVFRPDLEDRMSKGYYRKEALPRFYDNVYAAGSVRSTALDMSKFMRMVLAGGRPVLSPTGLEEMLTPQNLDVPLDLDGRIGLGWVLSDPEMEYAGRLAWHNGSTIFFNSHMEILLDQGLGVVVLTNSVSGGGAAGETAREILAAAVKVKSGLSRPAPPKPEYSPPAQWSQAELEALAGAYVEVGYGPDQVEAVEGGLNLTLYGQDQPVFLIPRENGLFSAPDSQAAQYEFTNISERDVIVIHASGNRYLYGQKYTPKTIPDVWTERTGVYLINNLPENDLSNFVPIPGLRTVPNSIELTVENGFLLYKNMGSIYVVDPVDDGRGVLFGLGRAGGTSVRADAADGRSRLTILGMEFVLSDEQDRTSQPAAKEYNLL